jgi:hypothetical protein
MRKSNPKLDQEFMEQHDAIHAFLGALPYNYEGEVLVTSFKKWLWYQKILPIQEVITLFREAEKEERDHMSPEESLQPLTEQEIERYVKYFTILIEEAIKQTGHKPTYESIVNMSILQTPDGWVGKRQISLLGWLGRLFRVI